LSEGDAQVDVAVVGGGPAGMAAAVAARRAGASVALIDEYAAPGGQIWRRKFSELEDIAPRSLPRTGRRLCAELAGSGTAILAGWSVWAATSAGAAAAAPLTLLLAGPDGASRRVRARAVVLATGAYDRPLAFPGWTLPGVMTAGGAQALAKGQGVLPGRRVLLAGAGPFLLPVARQLRRGGAEVVAVVEATRRREWLAAAPRMAAHPGRLGAYAGYRARMASTRFVWGHVLVRAEGAGRVEHATIAAAAPDWSPRPGSERRFDVDAVCTAYGFLPSVELARSLGCALRGDAVEHDQSLRTTVPGVFVAGEAAGIGGSDLAIIEGGLAGLHAAKSARAAPRAGEAPGAAAAGKIAGSPREIARLRRRRARAGGFAAVLEDLFGGRPGLAALADADTVLCRCEDVTAGAIDAAGADSPAALKIVTRCGQGPCQGRVCERLIADRLGTPARFSARPPVTPIPLGVLIDQAAPER
jgi:NADPH-dependent 2,4-dienoyl-CoA reductase/sulfur reductase-like enzyme